MNLKTSYFNTAIFKANIKRFWWVAAIYFIAFLTFGILPLIDSHNMEGFYFMTIFSCGIAAIMPTILFSYLDFAGSSTCLHAFPIKRKAHFITHIITIYAMIIIPSIICYIIGWIYKTAVIPKDNLYYSFGTMFILNFMIITIFMSGGILGNMVTGNPISAIAFSGLFIGFPYYTEVIFTTFLQENVYGLPSHEPVTFAGLSITQFTPYMVISFIVWLAIIILSWFLYKYRNLETNGDIISFKFLKPIFIGCVSVFLGLLGYFYFVEIFGYKSIFFILPFGLLGVIVSNMLSRKAFTLKGVVKPGAIYIACVVLLYAVITYDLTGFERRIPKTDDIASVSIIGDGEMPYSRYLGYDNTMAGWIDDKEYYYSSPLDENELIFTESEDIQKVTALHKNLIDTRPEVFDRKMPIVYTLKNGSTLTRSLPVNYVDNADALKPVYETKQLRLNKYYIFRNFEKTINDITVLDKRITGDNSTFDIYIGDSEKAKALLTALEADVMEADYNTIINYNSDAATHIEISYTRPIESAEGKPYTGNKNTDVGSANIDIGITPAFKRTIALLNEYGLDDKVMKAEQIAYANVIFNNASQDSLKITGREEISQLYNFCFKQTPSSNKIIRIDENIYDIEIYFYDENDNGLFSQYYDTSSSDWPAFLIYEAQKWASAHADIIPEKTEHAVVTQETSI